MPSNALPDARRAGCDQCPAGRERVGEECSPCKDGMFSISGERCVDCPGQWIENAAYRGALCKSGVIEVKDDWWYTPPLHAHTTFYRCVTGACLKPPNLTLDSAPLCAKGHNSSVVKCAACVDEWDPDLGLYTYAKGLGGRCVECSGKLSVVLATIGTSPCSSPSFTSC